MKFRMIKFLVKAISVSLISSIIAISPAHASNCSSVTGTSLGQTSNLWLFQWNALTDTSNVDGLNIFVTSGSGSQSWYNNVNGYFWTGLSGSATMFLANKLSLISFMNERGITQITFSIRKDNGTDGCYPLTTIGTITPSRLSSPANIQVTQTTFDKATITFDSDPWAASNTLTLIPTEGGDPRVITNYVSGNEITDLSAATSYTVSVSSLGGIARINSSSTDTVFTTPQDPIEVARIAYLAKIAKVAQAKSEIQSTVKLAKSLDLELLAQAEVKGATKSNLPLINKELSELAPDKRGDLKEILKVIRKYEVIDILASPDSYKVQSSLLVEIGLIPSDSKNKTSLVTALRRLNPADRSSYEDIQAAIKLEMQSIQARKERTANIIEKIKSRK